MVDKHFCVTCSKYISKSNKSKHEKTEIHNKKLIIKQPSGGDLQTISTKLPDFPWSKYKGEHHLPRYSYAGPGTRLDIRLNDNDQPNPGEEPINRVDEAALKHDIVYRNNDIRSRQKADIDLIQDLNEIKKPTLSERLGRVLVKNAMKLKIMFGGDLNENELLAQELHKEYRKPKIFFKFLIKIIFGREI